ncbi:MAG: acetyl-CoA carboxylase carboxyltransferase subunit alpha [Cellulosilyticaceae bacterium]
MLSEKQEDMGVAWEKVEIARHKERPSPTYYIESIFDEFMVLKGDRYFGEDASIIGGIGKLAGIPVTVIGTVKGDKLQEKIKCNFGMPKPEGYRKALRLMKQAEKFKRPIICLIDTPGAYCGLEAEERGIARAIADNLIEMSRMKTPIIAVFVGEGGSGGALALGLADKVLMLENATYSILSPEGFATILWKDVSRAKEAASVMKITADELYALGVIDAVVKEPEGGAHYDPKWMAELLKEKLLEQVYDLIEVPEGELVKKRYDKFREMGI